MKKLSFSVKIKKFVNLTVLLAGILFIVALFIFKDNLTKTASDMIKMQADAETLQTAEDHIDSAYNYNKNAQSYRITFLEFGSAGCSACKRMEQVMEEIRGRYPEKVNVIFYNVTFPENRKLMKYYGISAIPTQILLDAEGEEFFRHVGYYPADKLSEHFPKFKKK